MRQKFVVRLMDNADRLLAWATVWAVAAPQGRPHSCVFKAETPTLLAILHDGEASRILVHWCDLDLVRSNDIMGGPVAVAAGTTMTFSWVEPVWLVPAGGYQGTLPAVEVGGATIAPPTGNLAAVGNL